MIDEFPHHIRVRCDRPRDLARALCGTADVAGIEFPDEHTVEVLTHQPDRTYPAIVEQALDARVAVESLTSPDATMEAVFHYLVERGARIKQEALVEKTG
jgi:ABC-2 type transport system ATP-binding protein